MDTSTPHTTGSDTTGSRRLTRYRIAHAATAVVLLAAGVVAATMVPDEIWVKAAVAVILLDLLYAVARIARRHYTARGGAHRAPSSTAHPAPATPAPSGVPAAGPAPTAPGWTAERIQALGTTTSLGTAADIFGISAATAYGLARQGAFPVPVIRVGNRYRVPVAPILAVLGLDPSPADRAATTTPPAQ
ncbi:helix-turn-helix domain-containing protein [Actinoplanes sp. NPDC051475]|uniref:helix-turn-helix domain-containing protein n=1 Tax=Actinoplanes sp. NPDC051475 TaxID=3157225 RepID=UPI00344BA444